jgi:hypothetical protein
MGNDDTFDSTLEDQVGGYDDFGLDYFDFLHGVPCSGMQEELGGSQLGGVPPMGIQDEEGRSQEGRSYQTRDPQGHK